MSTTTKSKIVLRQVLMRRFGGLSGLNPNPADDERLYFEDVYWIDNSLAKIGKRVRDNAGMVWTIIETYGAKNFDDVDAQHDAWKRWAAILEGH